MIQKASKSRKMCRKRGNGFEWIEQEAQGRDDDRSTNQETPAAREDEQSEPPKSSMLDQNICTLTEKKEFVKLNRCFWSLQD